MEEREAKHIAIPKYTANTSYLHWWEQVFCHEHISLIWLHQHGYNAKIKTASTTRSYIPKCVSGKGPEFCCRGFNKDVLDQHCRFCDHKLPVKIKKSLEDCQVIQI